MRGAAHNVRAALSVRTRLRRWRRSARLRRRMRLMLTSLFILVVIPFVVWLVARQTIPDATDVIEVQGVPVDVVSDNGYAYSATADGRVTVVDAARKNVIRGVAIGHPVTALAIRSNALFALGPGVISRLSAAGERELTRRLPHARPTRLSGGPKGLWATGGRGGRAVQIDPQTLDVRSVVPLRSRAGGITVTRKGAWVSQPERDEVVRIGLNGSGSFAPVERRAVPGRPGQVAAAGGKIVVLTRAPRTLVWFDETAPQVVRRLGVDPTTRVIAATGSSAWALSPMKANATEIDLEKTRRIGRPVPIARAGAAATADLTTLWTSSGDRNTLTRLDLGQVDTVRQRGREWNTPWGLNPAVYLGSMLFVLGVWLVSIASWRRTDPNAGLPRYELGPRIRVVALDPLQWSTVSIGTPKARRVKKGWAAGGTLRGIFIRNDTSTEEEYNDEPVHSEVLRALESLLRIKDLVVHGLSYVNGARRRWLPFRMRGPHPPAIRRRLAVVGSERLCLVRGSWRVDEPSDAPPRFLLRLDHLFDRVRGDWVPVPVPEDAWLHVECNAEWLTELGRNDIVPGAEIELDVLALSCRVASDEQPLRLRLIAAYQRLVR